MGWFDRFWGGSHAEQDPVSLVGRLVQQVRADPGLDVDRELRRAPSLAADPMALAAVLLPHLDEVHPGSPAWPALLRVTEAVADANPAADTLALLRVNAVRRTDPQRALALARVWDARARSYTSGCSLLACLRRTGDVDGALAVAADLHQREPTDPAPLLDAGDALLEVGAHAEALTVYERALVVSPAHPWAEPSAWFARAQLGDSDADVRLRAMAGDNERAAQLAAAGEEPPGTALVDVARQVVAQMPEALPPPTDGRGHYTVSARLSHLEAPSAHLACQQELERNGRPVVLSVEVETIQAPDPRRPDPSVPALLWRFEGVVPSPALPAPPEDVRRAVAEVARLDGVAGRWWALASRIDAEPMHLAAAMVHPTPAPAGILAWRWWWRTQRVAALALASRPDGVALLETIVRGPVDWAGCAAAAALGEAAIRGRPTPLAALIPTLRPPDGGDWCLGDAVDRVLDRLRRHAAPAVGAIGAAVVTHRVEYGLFVDLDGHRALLHRTHLVPVPPVDDPTHGGIDVGCVLRVEVIRVGDDLLGVAHRPYALPG